MNIHSEVHKVVFKDDLSEFVYSETLRCTFFGGMDTIKETAFHLHYITTTHVTTPFAKEDLRRAFFAEIYYLIASEKLLIYLHPIFSHSF